MKESVFISDGCSNFFFIVQIIQSPLVCKGLKHLTIFLHRKNAFSYGSDKSFPKQALHDDVLPQYISVSK